MEEDIFDIGNITIEKLPSLSLKDNFIEQLKERPKVSHSSRFVPYNERDFTLFFYEGGNMLGVVVTFYCVEKFKEYLDTNKIRYTDYQIGNLKGLNGNKYLYCATKPGDDILLIREGYQELKDDLKRYNIIKEEESKSNRSFMPGFESLFHRHNTDFKEHTY